jgi:transcriptional regulator with XRE-family HTH domain
MLIPPDLSLKPFRLALDLSQAQLAELLGVPFYSIPAWERRGRASRAAVALLRSRLPQIREERGRGEAPPQPQPSTGQSSDPFEIQPALTTD